MGTVWRLLSRLRRIERNARADGAVVSWLKQKETPAKVTTIALATAFTLTSTLALAQIRGTRIWISRGSFGGFVRRYGEFGCAAASATLAAAPQFTALFVRAYSANRRANA